MNYSTLAAAAWQQAQADRADARRREWITALICARKTAAWRDIGISQDVRDKLAAAWAIYTALRVHDVGKARELRRLHGYRRWLDMGALWVRYEFAPAAALAHIESELSNAAMVNAIKDAHDPQPEWLRKLNSVVSISEKINTAYDIPDEERARLTRVLQELRGILQRYQ